MYRYTAYELDIASELELPELVPAEGTPPGTPDITIRLGSTPPEIENVTFRRPVWTVNHDAWLQEIEDVGRYYVHRGGTEVVIERTGGTDAELRCYFFGTVLGAIFHQRHQFVLHACAVTKHGGAIVLTGNSGSGKSTTLATLLERGYELLSDDKTILRFGDDGPEVLSGYPTMRLWGDAAERMHLDPATLPELLPGKGKYLYQTPAFRHEPAPLRALVMLHVPRPVSKGGPPDEALTGVETRYLSVHRGIQTILRQTYRRSILNGLGLQAEHFQWATRIGDAVPVIRIVRPRLGDTVEAVADAVDAVAASTAATLA